MSRFALRRRPILISIFMYSARRRKFSRLAETCSVLTAGPIGAVAMDHLESPFRQEPQSPQPRPQFNLRNLLYFTTGLCVLFALLGAIGVTPLQTLIGFGFVTAIVIVQAALIDLLLRRW